MLAHPTLSKHMTELDRNFGLRPKPLARYNLQPRLRKFVYDKINQLANSLAASLQLNRFILEENFIIVVMALQNSLII
jgi:hypothetical protein